MMKITAFIKAIFLCGILFFIGNLQAKECTDSSSNEDSLSISISADAQPKIRRGHISRRLGRYYADQRRHARAAEANRRWRERRDARLLKEPAISKFLDKKYFYTNEKGSVILDASLFRLVTDSEHSATCVSCHEIVKLNELFDHYNSTAHQFFYNVTKSSN